MKIFQHLVPAMILGLSFMLPIEAANLYRLTDLGVLPGGNISGAYGINNAGQVVGVSQSASGNGHAFLWTASGGMQDLGDLHGGWDSSFASDINDTGQVVGYSFAEDLTNGQAGNQRAFVWTSSGGMQGLGVLPGYTRSYATGINNVGQAVGISEPASFAVLHTHGFLGTSGDGIRALLDLPGSAYSTAHGINDAGQVVGAVGNVLPESFAYRWSSAEGIEILGALPGSAGSQALDINNAGQVVGDSGNEFLSHAFLWTAGDGMRDLGDLPGGYDNSQGLAINDAGQVVGVSYNDAGRRAYLWTTANGMRDLNTLLDGSGAGWILADANAVNNAGQIVGEGFNPAGQLRAFLLTPVPEPASLALIVLSLVLLVLRRKSPAKTSDHQHFKRWPKTLIVHLSTLRYNLAQRCIALRRSG